MLRSWGVERYGSTLERYEMIVRGAVDAHGGHAFEMVGDSFISVFGRARVALFAAVEARDAFRRADWVDGWRPGVRIGSRPARPSAGGRGTSGSA
jgi:class 3 adenylate cyclase